MQIDIEDIARQAVQDIANDARDFWDGLQDHEIEQAREAARRYAENQLMALTDPAGSDQHLKNAAHNLNTLTNLTASSKIKARAEARAIMGRVIERIVDISFRAIDTIL